MITYSAVEFPVLATLEACLLADCSRLIELESELRRKLDESHERVVLGGSPGDWDTGCQHHWDHVSAVLRRMQRLSAEMNDAVMNSQPEAARSAWGRLQWQEDRLVMAVCGLSDQSLHLNETAALDWKALLLIIESHRRAVKAGVQGLDTRLESWAAHCMPGMVAITLPGSGLKRLSDEALDTASYQSELDQAAIQIGAEQHQEMGMLDGVKALFMWVETPDERVIKNHARARL